jgi:hypothetical protein
MEGAHSGALHVFEVNFELSLLRPDIVYSVMSGKEYT